MQRADWMAGRWGLMVHWIAPGPLPENPPYRTDLNDAVDNFDVSRFLQDFAATGADWLIFTVGQNTGYYVSPNWVLDSLLEPGHCSRRDLVGEIAEGVHRMAMGYVEPEPEEKRPPVVVIAPEPSIAMPAAVFPKTDRIIIPPVEVAAVPPVEATVIVPHDDLDDTVIIPQRELEHSAVVVPSVTIDDSTVILQSSVSPEPAQITPAIVLSEPEVVPPEATVVIATAVSPEPTIQMPAVTPPVVASPETTLPASALPPVVTQPVVKPPALKPPVTIPPEKPKVKQGPRLPWGLPDKPKTVPKKPTLDYSDDLPDEGTMEVRFEPAKPKRILDEPVVNPVVNPVIKTEVSDTRWMAAEFVGEPRFAEPEPPRVVRGPREVSLEETNETPEEKARREDYVARKLRLISVHRVLSISGVKMTTLRMLQSAGISNAFDIMERGTLPLIPEAQMASILEWCERQKEEILEEYRETAAYPKLSFIANLSPQTVPLPGQQPVAPPPVPVSDASLEQTLTPDLSLESESQKLSPRPVKKSQSRQMPPEPFPQPIPAPTYYPRENNTSNGAFRNGAGSGSKKDKTPGERKRFIAYLPCEIAANKTVQKAFAWNTEEGTDQKEFQKWYTRFVKEWSQQWGKRVSGWWFDGCYTWQIFHNKQMDWPLWFNACRAGNPDTIVAFNDGSFCVNSLKPVTHHQDFISGEAEILKNGKIRLGRSFPATYHLPTSRFVEGTECQWHALVPIDCVWTHGGEPTGVFTEKFSRPPVKTTFPMEKPVYSDEELLEFMTACLSVGGAVTLNVGIYQEGHLGPETVAQLKRIAPKLREVTEKYRQQMIEEEEPEVKLFL